MKREDYLKPVEIAPQTYWVGKRQPGAVFFANPYLRVFEGDDKQGRPQRFNLLIDPGSSSDFSIMRAKTEALIGGLDRVSAIFINHQDPDVASSASKIMGRYARRAVVLTSEETWRLIVHSNLPRDRCIYTEKYPRGFTLPTSHQMVPVPSPFCHFVGAVMLYDPETRVLFTGDLFGGLTPRDATGFLADEGDWTGVRAFHQLYMPSNVALRRAVQRIRSLQPRVEMIAPQHGRLLRGEMMEEFMDRLERLEVGLDNLDERMSDGDTLPAWNAVLERVLETARNTLGDDFMEDIAADRELAADIEVRGDRVEIKQLGKSCVERIVRLITRSLPATAANIIQYEAILAAEDLDLPVPRMSIEEAHGSNGEDDPFY